MSEPTAQQIREYARNHTQQQTRQHFGITRKQLIHAIGEITLRKPWHDPDVFAADLRKFKNNVPLLAKYYGIAASSIYSRKKRMQMPNLRKAWGKKHDAFIVMHIHTMSAAEIGKHLKRTARAVYERAKNIGITYKSAMGYTNTMLATDLHTSTSQISTWAEKNALPYEQHSSGHRSYDVEAVYQWLEAGNILRLGNIEQCSQEYQAMYAQAMLDYVGALELQTYGFNATEHARALKQFSVGRMWGFGNVYKRSDIYDYLTLWVPSMKVKPLPDETWFAGLIAAFHSQYIKTSELAAMIYRANVSGGLYKQGLPRPVKPGIHSRAEVIAWLQTSGKHSKMLEGLTNGK